LSFVFTNYLDERIPDTDEASGEDAGDRADCVNASGRCGVRKERHCDASTDHTNAVNVGLKNDFFFFGFSHFL
jgi:hypothetical protein